jgi:predicted dehydrogenase
VIGYGYWGPNLARNIAECPRMRLAAVADGRPARLAEATRRAGDIRVHADGMALIEDPAIDAVAIATPVSTHFALASAALAAGKHVLVTKPMTSTLAEADALVEQAAQSDRVLLVDHTFVYTGAVRRMRQMLTEGVLGRLYYLDSVRVNLGLFQHDVNVVWDLAAHDIAIFDHLLDQTPLSVSASGASHSPSGLEDVAYVHLQYADDLIAHIHVNWLSPVKIRQTLVGGSQQMLVWNDLVADEKLRLYDRGIETPTDERERHQAIVAYRTGDAWIPTLERHEALAMEIEHFADCILGGAEPLTGGSAGREVIRVLEAASQSLQAGGRPVDLAAGTVA